jgi:DNA-binding MarR family transcriptional regulator
MSMVSTGIIKRSSCKSNAVSRVSVGQHKLVRARGNRELGEHAGITDEGQISKLLARLEGHGLLQNTGGHTHGLPNAWQLTPRGEEILRASTPNNRGATPSFPEETA